MDKAFLEQMQKKVAQELRAKETETVTFWKEEIEKVVRKNTESLSALQVEIKNLAGAHGQPAQGGQAGQ